MSEKNLKIVKESDLKKALANFHDKDADCIQLLDWSEAKGSAANDGFTTELIAVKGKSNISGKNQDFSFMVKMTPETGHRVNMVKEVFTFKILFKLPGQSVNSLLSVCKSLSCQKNCSKFSW